MLLTIKVMELFARKRKGMEMAINTTVMLVVLLVLLLVLLLLVSRGSDNYTDTGVDKIDEGGDFTNCQILCYKCCHGNRLDCGAGAPVEIAACNCEDKTPTETGC